MVSEGLSLALIRDDRKYPLGLFGSGLVDAVEGNPRAEKEARAFRNSNVSGFVMVLVGGVGAMVGASMMLSSIINRPNSGAIASIGAGVSLGGLGCMVAGAVISAVGSPRIWDAINIYNDSLPIYVLPPPRGGSYPAYPAGSLQRPDAPPSQQPTSQPLPPAPPR